MELAAVLAIKAPWVSTAPLGTPEERIGKKEKKIS